MLNLIALVVFVNGHVKVEISQCIWQIFTVNICSSPEESTRKEKLR